MKVKFIADCARLIRAMTLYAGTFAFVACAPAEEQNTRMNKLGSIDAQGTQEPAKDDSDPITKTQIRVDLTDQGDLSPAISRKTPEQFAPRCLSSSSRLAPTLVVGDTLGLRQLRPDAVMEVPQDVPPILNPGWAVHVHPQVTGTAFPDFARLPAVSPIIQDRPDFDGAVAPGNLTRNFAIRASTTVDLPLARTIGFQLTARAVARIRVNGTIVLTTAVSTAAAPVAVTANVPLNAGKHSISVEYINGNLVPLFSVRMRLGTTGAYGLATPTGAVPFAVETPASPPPVQDPLQSRAIQWPGVAGSEGIATCTASTPTLNEKGAMEQAYTDVSNILRVSEQSTVSMTPPLKASDIKSLWVAPSSWSDAALVSAVASEDQIGLGFADGSTSVIAISELIQTQPDIANQVKILGAGQSTAPDTSASTLVLVAISAGKEQKLVTLQWSPASGSIRVVRRNAPWKALPHPVATTATHAIVLVDKTLQGVALDGSKAHEFKIDLDIDAAVQAGRFLALWNKTGQIATIEHAAIDAAIRALEKSEAGLEVATGSIQTMSSELSADPGTLWLDDFMQFWTLDATKTPAAITVWTRPSMPLLHFSSSEGVLWVDQPNKLSTIRIFGGDSLLIDTAFETGAKMLALRSMLPKEAADHPQLAVTIRATSGDEYSTVLPTILVANWDSPRADPPSSSTTTTTTRPIASPPPVVVSWDRDIRPFIQRSCLGGGCHNTVNPAAGRPLQTRQELQDGIAAAIGAAGPNGSMPIGRRQRLSAAELQLLANWRTANFPP